MFHGTTYFQRLFLDHLWTVICYGYKLYHTTITKVLDWNAKNSRVKVKLTKKSFPISLQLSHLSRVRFWPSHTRPDLIKTTSNCSLYPIYNWCHLLPSHAPDFMLIWHWSYQERISSVYCTFDKVSARFRLPTSIWHYSN